MRKLLMGTCVSISCMNMALATHANTTNYFINGVANDHVKANRSTTILEDQTDVGGVNLLHNSTEGIVLDLKEVVAQIYNLDAYYTDNGGVASYNYDDATLSTFFNSPLYTKSVGDVVAKVVGIYQNLLDLDKDQEAREVLENTLQAIGCGELPRSFNGVTTRLLSSYECEVLQLIDTDISKLEDIVLAVIVVHQNDGAIFLRKNLAYSDTNRWLTQIGNLATNKINLACHSQGNEFCNRLATHIDGQGYGDSVKVLSVGTPDDYVYGDGRYVTLQEDIVSWSFLGSLPRNATNHDPNRRYHAWDYPGENLNKYGDFTGHGFNESYMLDESFSKEFIVNHYLLNHRELIKQDCPECFTGTELSYGHTTAMWTNSDGSPDYYNSGHAKDYTFRATRACQKVEFRVDSEVDSFIDLRTNGVLIGNDDNGGGSNDARLIRDINGGTYNIELTGKSLYSNSQLNKFGVTIIDRGNCDSVESSNIYVEDSSVDYQTSGIYLTHGQEITMRTYQKYSGNVSNSDLANPNLEYVFSRDQNLSSNDLVVEDDYSTIGSDDTSDGEREYYTIPTSMGTGRWYVGFVADSDNEIQETDESDNIEWVEVNISSSGPSSQEDVYLEDEPDGQIMYVGERYRLRIRQYYTGDKTSSELGSIRLRYYLSDNDTYSSNDEYLGSDTSSIGTNDEYDSESFYFTPDSSQEGLKYIIFYADASEDVDESDEDNNFVAIQAAILD